MLLGQKHKIVHRFGCILGEQLHSKVALAGLKNSLVRFAGIDDHLRRLGPAFGRTLGR
ncbi:hypothetical protein D3C75_1325220 [compost metagenome]